MAEKIRNNALRFGIIGEYLIELILVFKLIRVGKFWSYVAALIMIGDVGHNTKQVTRMMYDAGSELIGCDPKEDQRSKKAEKIQMGFVVDK